MARKHDEVGGSNDGAVLSISTQTSFNRNQRTQKLSMLITILVKRR